MTRSSPIPAENGLTRQVPSFVAIGLFGYCVDAGVTYLFAQACGFDPLLARPPAFALATVLNFALNRRLTFSHSTVPLWRAFARYVAVCAVGLIVNYAVYALCVALAPLIGLAATPAMLPLYVACGSGAAMFVTFFGFKSFAFRV